MAAGNLAYAEEQLSRQARRTNHNFVALVTPADKLNSQALDLAAQ